MPRPRLEQHHRRCAPALVRLRMLMSEAEPVNLTEGLRTEMVLLMDEVMAELTAADRTLVESAAGTGRCGPVADFLNSRLVRLRTAAGEVAAAGRGGDVPALRRRLDRFCALSAATGKVQLGLSGPARGSGGR